MLGILQESGLVHRSGSEDAEGQWHWTSESYPANAVSLRSISSDNFVITDHTDGAKVIGETDFTSALSTLHPKAIYMVEGKIFQVEELDFVGRKAHVKEVDCDYYTTAITYTKVSILDRFAEDAPKVALHGEVHVVSRVVGFKKIRFQTNENVGSGELDLPEQQMHTTAYWLEMPLSIMNALPYAADDRRDGVVGLAFAMKQIAQLLLMCDGRDVGLSVNAGETDGDDTPRIFLYDAYPGGIGFSAPLWGMQTELLSKTSALIAGCDCDNGCPMCVGPIGETGPLQRPSRFASFSIFSLHQRSATAQAVALRVGGSSVLHGDARSTSRHRQESQPSAVPVVAREAGRRTAQRRVERRPSIGLPDYTVPPSRSAAPSSNDPRAP